MNRIDRLMGIITLIQSKKHLTVAQIATHYGNSERTVFRDLKAIGEIGVPIFFEPEKGYSNALSIAEPLIVRFADKSIQNHYDTALNKIKMVLGRTQRENIEKIRESTAHFIPDHYQHLMPSTDYLIPLQNAISNQKIVKIEYQNLQDGISTRSIEPIGLTFYSLNWHVIAWCQLRKEYRDFRVSRIQNLQVTMQPFINKEHISLNNYLQDIQNELVETNEHPLH
jgi:predicted DNA-binding transcriptional regulator YafY